MSKRMILMINPKAGRGQSLPGLQKGLQIFFDAGYVPQVVFTSDSKDASRLAAEFGRETDLFVCLGGDGTLSDVMSGLSTISEPPLLGYIPCGTTNDVANTLHLIRRIPEAAEAILNGRAIPYDIGCFGDSATFSYVAAFGAFTDVSYETPQQAKATYGHLAYILEGMGRLPKIKFTHAVAEYDGKRIEDDFLFGGVTNSSSVAGLVKLNQTIDGLGDGLFEVLLIRKPKNIFSVPEIIQNILNQNYTSEYIMQFQSSRIRFSFNEPVAWTRDGENGGKHTDLDLSIHPTKIHILIPPES